MRLVFALLVSCAVLVVVGSAERGIVHRQVPPQGTFIGENPLPPIEFTTQEMIDVLTEYSLVHSDSMMCSTWFGVTDFRQKQIEICDRYDLTDRRETIIHEMLHIIYRKRGIETGGPMEYPLDAIAQRIFHQLYDLSATTGADKPSVPGSQ